MLSMMLFLLGSSGPMLPQQSVNGGEPQRQDTSTARATKKKEHWTDPVNTKRAPDPRKRDEYGAPKVTPPTGQGTDNPGGIPEPRLHPPHAKNGVEEGQQLPPGK